MLRELRIENLALFDEALVEFGPGLNVLSGETGAGKTMLISALRGVLGEKVDPSLIATGSQEAYLESVWDRPKDLDCDLCEEGEDLILARRVRRSASRAMICGRSCSASLLAETGSRLVSLTGQHAARRLSSPAFQLSLVDRAAGIDLAEISGAWADLQKARDEARETRRALLEKSGREDLLRHECELIDLLAPVPGEEEKLSTERDRQIHAVDLAKAMQETYSLLRASDGSASEKIGTARSGLEKISAHEPEAGRLALELEEIEERALAVAAEAMEIGSGYGSDPRRLDEIEERLQALREIRRRYRNQTIEEILERHAVMREELATLEGGDSALEKLEEAERKAESRYTKIAGELRKKRRRAAGELRRATLGHLESLGLAGADFLVEIEAAPPGPGGTESARMALSANPSMDPAPIHRAASGGEISRVNLALMLAVEQIDGGGRDTFVFDEIDAGIGGSTAHAVAAKLADLATTSQVLVITHLAQIAVRADILFRIKKSEGQTRIEKITDETGRRQEIARLIGAEGSSAAEDVESMLREAAAAASS